VQNKENDSMEYIPCPERVFALKLPPTYVRMFTSYAHWLKHLLERLGRGPALEVWQRAFRDGGDALLEEILGAGWEALDDDEVDALAQGASVVDELFTTAVEGVSAEEAKRILAQSPPILQIGQRLPSLNAVRETTAYEALHVVLGQMALLAEALIELHGKEGELIAYDILSRQRTRGLETVGVAEFLGSFTEESPEPDIFSAGLESKLVRAGETEVVVHIVECEWARYFREHHPRVGYLIACSGDEAHYRAANPRLRLQRTSTLMEGGEVCDFRVYAVSEEPADSSGRSKDQPG
jgi:hypothetical protein